MEIIKINDLSFRYPDMEEYALNNISLTIKTGEFVVICGPSGCGKTTLLSLLKKELAPVGEISGEILYLNKRFLDYDDRTLMEDIGLVSQDPDNQIVMDEVLQEIVFGLENLGYSHFEMRKRVAEMVHFFGMENLLKEKPSELSGGQKQMINLLSALLLKPKVLLLDEPTSQLDPVAAKDLIIMLERLNKEMGMTIILVEHRLEELFSVADHVYIMDKGEFITQGSSREIIHSLYADDNQAFIPYIPSLSRLYMEREQVLNKKDIPLTVKESREWLATFPEMNPVKKIDEPEKQIKSPYLELKDTYFQYDKKASIIFKNLSLQIARGEYFALVGGNGSGKTTVLKTCLGTVKPQRGSVKLNGKDIHKMKGRDLYQGIAYLPQNPQTYFMHDTVKKEMEAEVDRYSLVNGEEKIISILKDFGITHLQDRHPYDCSGGEMQKAALSCMLLAKPDILFIDEPTKGIDPVSKIQLGVILKRLHNEGLTIVMVTHDIEFAAIHAERCAMLFDGEIAITGTPNALFKGNYFYTTAINRATRNSHIPEVLTLEEALSIWPNHVPI